MQLNDLRLGQREVRLEMDEYRRVLEEMTKKRPPAVLGSILALIELHSEMVEPMRVPRAVCRSPTMTNSRRRQLPQKPIPS